ncbi:MAG: corrinoid methyltransferase [Candidatus Bathyarchaeota archaeon B24]|nr:MAG: corrinoid methyltransferase [Candidatus Bathyarchaeota archaeon B24]
MFRLSRKEEILARLRDAIVNLDYEGIRDVAKEAIEAGLSPYEAIMEGMAKGMDIVGQKYEQGEYFLAELIMAGETMKEGLSVLEPYMKKGEIKHIGKVVIGTVEGDLHDIGKNIVITLLTASGFEVVDLGVDVSAEKFVEAVRKHKPDIVAMSALLTTTMVNMEKVVKALEEAGLRDKVKIIVGGAPLTEEFAKQIGADAYGRDAVVGVEICRRWVSEKG